MNRQELNSNLGVSETHHHLDTLAQWSIVSAYGLAATESIRLTEEHIKILNWLRHYFDQHGYIDEVGVLKRLVAIYAVEGGLNYLRHLFPRDVMRQSLYIAGLPLPARERYTEQ